MCCSCCKNINFFCELMNYKYLHHFLLSLRGHRVSTKRRHLILFLTILSTSPQLSPFSNASFWTNLLYSSLSSFPPAGSNPRSLFRWLHFLSSMYAVSNSISVSWPVWTCLFPLSFSKVLHLRSIPASGYSTFFVSSGQRRSAALLLQFLPLSLSRIHITAPN